MSMVAVEDLEELQQAVIYRNAVKSLKTPAIGSIIFGLIGIIIGLATISIDFLNIIVVLIGVFLLVEGIWLIASPHLKGLIIDGIALCLLGVWNFVITTINTANGAGVPAVYVLAIFQVGWGVQNFMKYNQVTNNSHKLPTEVERRIDSIIDSVVKAPINTNDIVEFNADKKWKVELSGDVAIFVTTERDVIFSHRDNIVFTDRGKKGKNLEFTMNIGQRFLKGDIAPESYQKLESWKLGTTN